MPNSSTSLPWNCMAWPLQHKTIQLSLILPVVITPQLPCHMATQFNPIPISPSLGKFPCLVSHLCVHGAMSLDHLTSVKGAPSIKHLASTTLHWKHSITSVTTFCWSGLGLLDLNHSSPQEEVCDTILFHLLDSCFLLKKSDRTPHGTFTAKTPSQDWAKTCLLRFPLDQMTKPKLDLPNTNYQPKQSTCIQDIPLPLWHGYQHCYTRPWQELHSSSLHYGDHFQTSFILCWPSTGSLPLDAPMFSQLPVHARMSSRFGWLETTLLLTRNWTT